MLGIAHVREREVFNLGVRVVGLDDADADRRAFER
jgi:hypothetical protein